MKPIKYIIREPYTHSLSNAMYRNKKIEQIAYSVVYNHIVAPVRLYLNATKELKVKDKVHASFIKSSI